MLAISGFAKKGEIRVPKGLFQKVVNKKHRDYILKGVLMQYVNIILSSMMPRGAMGNKVCTKDSKS